MAEAIAAIGVAASVLQLADAGVRLSTRLFIVSKQVKNAPQVYAAVLQEVSLTSSALRQLGDILNDSNATKTHNQQSLDAITELTNKCKVIFTKLESIVTFTTKSDASSASRTLSEWRLRLSFPYKEKEIEEHRSALEKLQLLLNVILSSLSLAALGKSQHHQNDMTDMIVEQRDMLRTLLQTLRNEDAAALSRLTTLFQQPTSDTAPTSDASTLGENTITSTGAGVARDPSVGSISGIHGAPIYEHHSLGAQGSSTVSNQTQSRPQRPAYSNSHSEASMSTQAHSHGESVRSRETAARVFEDLSSSTRQRTAIREHARLTTDLIALVNNESYEIDARPRLAMHNSILELHHSTNRRRRMRFGVLAMIPLLADYPEIADHWAEEYALAVLEDELVDVRHQSLARHAGEGPLQYRRRSIQKFANESNLPKTGRSPDYIEDVLRKNKNEEKPSSLPIPEPLTQTSNDELALDMSRPTYIRVRIKHLYPETLDAYNLPWKSDTTDDRYIIIMQYISHELQEELFEHTRKIKVKRERMMMDDYREGTVTALEARRVPKNKESDEMYLVRRKSSSKQPSQRQWMFTGHSPSNEEGNTAVKMQAGVSVPISNYELKDDVQIEQPNETDDNELNEFLSMFTTLTKEELQSIDRLGRVEQED